MQEYLVFRLGAEQFGVRIGRVVEILQSQKVYEVPEIKEFIVGVISVRGEVIPLIDMRKRFGITSSPIKERTILVRTDEEKLGLIVDEVRDIVAFEPDEVTKSPTIFRGLPSAFLEGLGKTEERVIMLLNITEILTSEEKIVLSRTETSLEGSS